MGPSFNKIDTLCAGKFLPQYRSLDLIVVVGIHLPNDVWSDHNLG